MVTTKELLNSLKEQKREISIRQKELVDRLYLNKDKRLHIKKKIRSLRNEANGTRVNLRKVVSRVSAVLSRSSNAELLMLADDTRLLSSCLIAEIESIAKYQTELDNL